jgi:hypothetical protein
MPDGRSVDVLVPPGFKPGDVIGVPATEGCHLSRKRGNRSSSSIQCGNNPRAPRVPGRST